VNENAITHYKSVAAAKRNEKLLQEMGTTGNACVEPAPYYMRNRLDRCEKIGVPRVLIMSHDEGEQHTARLNRKYARIG
jgi:hypothetical protein